jgi:serine/threonine protein kinase/Tfp pilus assembly protein PilF
VTPPLRISHYEILDPIGRDGPAEIYRARDLRLERDVALKLLRPEVAKRPEAVERFRREARIASLVTHPHICTVHDSGEERGQPFIVLELLDGEPLDRTMARGPMSADWVIELGLQIADALGAAHRRGVIHGNLKPSNVFLTIDGHVKLLELGAAGAVAGTDPSSAEETNSRTSPAVLPLTTTAGVSEFFHPYLSPEQVAGSTPDQRSDIFAAGALLYEMATGLPAFSGKTLAETAANITEAAPVRPRTVVSRVPPALEAIIVRALEKAPDERHESAAELAEELRRARRTLEAQGRLAPLRSDRRVRNGAIAAAAAVVLLALTGSTRWWWGSAPTPIVERNTVLVSHIANGTADPDFDGTLRQAVSVYLAQSPYLDLASDERIRSTLQLMGRDPDARMTHAVAADVCQRLGLQAMLEGSVSAVGRGTIVALVATDCHTETTIAREQIEVERKEDVLRAVGQLTSTIRRSLGESGASLARNNVPIEEATTPSLEALKAYTEAVALRAAGAEVRAVKELERAIAIDPEFALAHTTLSSIYGGFGETGPSEEYARLAYEHRERVSERERLFIMYQYHERVTGDQLKAREALEVWKRTYPRDYRPPNALAVLLNRLGEYDAAAAEAQEAMRRNPEHAFPRSNLAHAHRGAGRYAEARAVAEEALARKLETVPMRRLLYQIAEIQGDRGLAEQQLRWAANHTRSFDLTGARAQVATFRGRMGEARKFFAETMAAATDRGFPQVASGYAAQAAFAELLYGYRGTAAEDARRVARTATAYEPRIRAATALALVGQPDEADAVVRHLRNVRPEDTLLQNAYVPVAEAAVLLARTRPDAAIEPLRRASPYEHGTIAALLPIYLRAEARLRAGATDEAVREFQVVLTHRGADPFSPIIPLAQLGLARAQLRRGDLAESRKAYDALFGIWADADADLPILRLARHEFARLTRN